MDYVEVIIVAPNKDQFTGKVDKDADEETLISDLVDELGLAKNKDYAINIIGAAKIRAGITIQIYEVKPPAVKDLKPINKNR